MEYQEEESYCHRIVVVAPPEVAPLESLSCIVAWVFDFFVDQMGCDFSGGPMGCDFFGGPMGCVVVSSLVELVAFAVDCHLGLAAVEFLAAVSALVVFVELVLFPVEVGYLVACLLEFAFCR